MTNLTAQEIALIIGSIAAILTAFGGYRLGMSQRQLNAVSAQESLAKAAKELLDPLTERICAQEAEMDKMRKRMTKMQSELEEWKTKYARLDAEWRTKYNKLQTEFDNFKRTAGAK